MAALMACLFFFLSIRRSDHSQKEHKTFFNVKCYTIIVYWSYIYKMQNFQNISDQRTVLIYDKLFINGPNKICGLQILLGPLLNS